MMIKIERGEGVTSKDFEQCLDDDTINRIALNLDRDIIGTRERKREIIRRALVMWFELSTR